ncbi:M24 family metallopeptidase [Shimazuella alba]|uniref:M24 family metallopeptidase n=1 Tax=Shimazuella alba TaxID=2690964 RepID=A0A6I4VST8_9BACL|nr:Xaa-Pro peptidase family protein [Shimazuella alba]MXQ53501.1 M24 family metallopeptidase [Shimazuella alba]
MDNRIDRIAKWLHQNELQAAFLTSSANVFYLTGFSCDPHERLLGVWVFPDNSSVLVCPLLEIERVKESGWHGEVYAYRDEENPWLWFKNKFANNVTKESKVAIEVDHLTYGRSLMLKEILEISSLVSIDEQIRAMRIHKTNEEIEILRNAAKLADQAIQYGVDALSVGCTELDVKNVIEKRLQTSGITKMAFETMVLFGERTALPHGVPGDRKLKAGDLVLFDLGVVLDGYCSDITRTVAFESITDIQKEIYEAVLLANRNAIKALQEKQVDTFGQVDHIARSTIEKAGYGSYFTHRLGHGLGIEAHEYPSVSSDNEQSIPIGSVFTIEPGVYVPESAGVRIEDMVLITDEGCEVLTTYPKELLVIAKG